jgi:hypothetical protein
VKGHAWTATKDAAWKDYKVREMLPGGNTKKQLRGNIFICLFCGNHKRGGRRGQNGYAGAKSARFIRAAGAPHIGASCADSSGRTR